MSSSNEIRFDGRVALVTGSGRGLGKTYVLAFAKRGAKVVVNDLDKEAVDQTVNEINKLYGNGTAIGDYRNCVTAGAEIIADIIKQFKRIDILINNAGITRDSSFARMTDTQWDQIYDVHLKGAYKATRAAWDHMRSQNYGRIIFTSSAAGLYGNFGQANYSVGKMGLVGFGQTLAIEGKRNNILVNVIAPVAGTKMTENIFPAEVLAKLKPEYVAPLVLYLTSEKAGETGGIFEVGAGWVSRVRVARGEGAFITKNSTEELTPEMVHASWSKINDFSKISTPTNAMDSFTPLLSQLSSSSYTGIQKDIQDVQGSIGSAPQAQQPKSPANNLKASAIFKQLAAVANDDKLVDKIGAVFQFTIHADDNKQVQATWIANFKQKPGSVKLAEQSGDVKADCTIATNDETFVGLMSGKIKPEQAFMSGKIKVSGKMQLATKLTALASLLPPASKL